MEITRLSGRWFTVLRVVLGWLFLYAGWHKISNSAWSAAGYLNGAKTFEGFYHWLASPGMLSFTNFINEWGLFIIGLMLIFGIWVRYAAIAGAIMMILYYFPILDFPYPNANSFIVDEHIIYAAAFAFIASAGEDSRWWTKVVSGWRKK